MNLTLSQIKALAEATKTVEKYNTPKLVNVNLMETSCYSGFTGKHDVPVIRVEFEFEYNGTTTIALDKQGRELYGTVLK
jgi:hypothetical protein